MGGSATIRINASPAAVWNLVSDVTQIGRFSPETTAAQWLEGVTRPRAGAKFRGRVKRNEKGPTYWTSCMVTECEPGRVFAFTVRSRPMGLPIAPKNTVCLTWRYTFEPAGDDLGTLVTEAFKLDDIPTMRLYWRTLGWLRGPRMLKDMERTLRALKNAAEEPQAHRPHM
ncbi:SRPBCC family protein [Mycobacterium sp. 1245852.3]|uniref:SRPBCC family protein n=1 Tax=Mycobacterium sp. 1245852.3 TaxID=1856860 RepID=UPI000800CB1C|nr:SRPBCC family protein [Mycobacterium sp. 1245852.3]OBK15274.1 cyclase [Mycobacterium sp. 1245852.3]